MIKNYTKKPVIMKVFIMLLLVVTTLSLSSCSNTYNRYPNTSFKDETYISLGDVKVTKGEVWDELRYSTKDLLTSKIEETVYVDYLNKVKETMKKDDSDATKKDYTNRLKEYAIKEIYSVDDVADLDTLDADAKKTDEQKYADDTYTTNGDVIDVNKLAKGDYTEVYPYFYNDLAKKLYGLNELEKEMKDRDSDDPYFDDSKVRDYYDSEYKNTGDIYALTIRFLSDDEAKQTLKAFGVKTYKSELYFIYPKDENQSVSDYNDYYDDFDFSKEAEDSYVNLTTLGNACVLQLYIEMYNYIYSYRSPIANDATIPANDTNSRLDVTEAITKIYEGNDKPTVKSLYDSYVASNENIQKNASYYKDISSSFLSYVSDDLANGLDEDAVNTDLPYSTSSKSYGDFNYMVFKFNQDKDEKILCADPDDETKITNDDLKNEIIEKLKDKEVSDSYIKNKIDDAKKDAKVEIFDTVLEVAYSQNATDYSRTRSKAPNENTLATIKIGDNENNLLLDDCYKKLDAKSGYTVALNLLSQKVIKDTDAYKKLDDKVSDYRKSLDNLFASFAQNQFSSYGYPASMGKYNFMLLYFHQNTVDGILNNYYRVSEAKRNVLNNYEDNTELLDMFKKYNDIAYDNFFKISASDLLVYVDMDEDGNPDKDFDWTTIDNNSGKTYKQLSSDLIATIQNLISHSTEKNATELTNLVTEYNSSSRFAPSDEDKAKNPTPVEYTWASFRRAGLYLKVNTLTDITSTSNSSTVDENIQKELKTIYNSEEFRLNETFPTEYIYNKSVSSEEGQNMLIITGASNPDSAKFTDNNIDSLFKNIPVIFNDKVIKIDTMENDSNKATLSQIKLYLFRYVENNTTDLTPTDVTTALETFFKPVYTRYTSNATQQMHLINYLDSLGLGEVKYDASTTDNATVSQAIAERKADSYKTSTDISNNFPDWWQSVANLYGGNK